MPTPDLPSAHTLAAIVTRRLRQGNRRRWSLRCRRFVPARYSNASRRPERYAARSRLLRRWIWPSSPPASDRADPPICAARRPHARPSGRRFREQGAELAQVVGATDYEDRRGAGATAQRSQAEAQQAQLPERNWLKRARTSTKPRSNTGAITTFIRVGQPGEAAVRPIEIQVRGYAAASLGPRRPRSKGAEAARRKCARGSSGGRSSPWATPSLRAPFDRMDHRPKRGSGKSGHAATVGFSLIDTHSSKLFARARFQLA